MPSIETVYLQSDIVEKMGDKHGVDLILDGTCTLESSQLPTKDSQGGNTCVDNDVVKTEGPKKEELRESLHQEVNHMKGSNKGSTVVVEVLDDEDAEEKEEKRQEDGSPPEVSHDPPPDTKSHDTKDESPDLSKILQEHVPGYDPARSKRNKAKLREVPGKAVPTTTGDHTAVGTEKESGLSDRFYALSLDGEEGEEEALRSKGPGMRGNMGVTDLPGAYSPSYPQSPGQMMASPPHDSLATLTAFGGPKVTPGMMDYLWSQSGPSYYPVSPPDITASASGYQQPSMPMSDADSIYSAQSPDECFQDIQTVIATAMQVRIPGQDEPGTQQPSPWGVNSGPPSVPSPQSRHSGEYNSTREFQEQAWPESSPESSLQGNPPSVSSAISDPDSVFNYTGAASPAGSTGTVVNSPVAPAMGYPHGVGSPCQMPESYSITASTNNNFGIVQVNRSSPGISPSPPSNKTEDIEKIVDELKAVERSQNGPLPPPYTAPTDFCRTALMPQLQNSIPSIQTFFQSPRPTGGSIGPIRSEPTRRETPYDMSDSHSSLYRQAEQRRVRINQTPLAMHHVERIHHERSAASSVYRAPEIPANTQPHPWVQQLTREQLAIQDYNEPYEGENMLQQLILNLRVEDSIAVVHRMVELGLNLNTTNDQRQSALLMAVFYNMPLLVWELVRNNADVQLGDNMGNFPMHYAASHGFVEVVNALESNCLGRGVHLNELDFNGKTPLMCAVVAHRTYQRFYVDGEEVRQLVDNSKMANRLIELGALPNKQDASSGKTALHYAISDRKLDMIRIIVEGDQSRSVARVPMSDGNTPLHLAVSLKCEQQEKCNIIHYLMSMGADISATNVEKNKPGDYVPDGHKLVKECLDGYSRNSKKR